MWYAAIFKWCEGFLNITQPGKVHYEGIFLEETAGEAKQRLCTTAGACQVEMEPGSGWEP